MHKGLAVGRDTIDIATILPIEDITSQAPRRVT